MMRDDKLICGRSTIETPVIQTEDSTDMISTSTSISTPNVEAVPKFKVEPPTPAINPENPFRDYPDNKTDEYQPQDTRDPHELLSEQQLMMDGELSFIHTMIYNS
jgi:hypothetical protein